MPKHKPNDPILGPNTIAILLAGLQEQNYEENLNLHKEPRWALASTLQDAIGSNIHITPACRIWSVDGTDHTDAAPKWVDQVLETIYCDEHGGKDNQADDPPLIMEDMEPVIEYMSFEELWGKQDELDIYLNLAFEASRGHLIEIATERCPDIYMTIGYNPNWHYRIYSGSLRRVCKSLSDSGSYTDVTLSQDWLKIEYPSICRALGVEPRSFRIYPTKKGA